MRILGVNVEQASYIGDKRWYYWRHLGWRIIETFDVTNNDISKTCLSTEKSVAIKHLASPLPPQVFEWRFVFNLNKGLVFKFSRMHLMKFVSRDYAMYAKVHYRKDVNKSK